MIPLPADEHRVELVTNVLAVAIPNASQWARAVIEALDRHDADAYVHDTRFQITEDDETDPDVEPALATGGIVSGPITLINEDGCTLIIPTPD